MRYLARAGVASRRKADELIKAGRVRVNGEPGELNTFVGVARRRRGRRRAGRASRSSATSSCNKPAGVVTTASDPQGRPTVVSLVGHESRVVPVGRLDVDTTGALLLTNDGPLAHRLAHPRYGVEKVYEVETWKEPTDEALRRLAEGSSSRTGRRHRRASAGSALHASSSSCTRAETRQVRRMCDAVGYRVRRLHRSIYAGLGIDGLAPGEWRELTPPSSILIRTTSAPPG